MNEGNGRFAGSTVITNICAGLGAIAGFAGIAYLSWRSADFGLSVALLILTFFGAAFGAFVGHLVGCLVQAIVDAFRKKS